MKHVCLDPFFDAVATYARDPRHFANLKLHNASAADPVNGLHTGLATLPGQFHQVDQLVQSRYAWRGYNLSMDSVPCREITLVTQKQSAVVGTLSMHFEDDAPLQADSAFSAEIDATRRNGGRACEVTRLATAEQPDSRMALGLLFRLAYLSARALRDMTHMFIEVNPRHTRFYELMSFDVASGVRFCERVCAPAVLLCLDFGALEEKMLQWLPQHPALQIAA